MIVFWGSETENSVYYASKKKMSVNAISGTSIGI